MAAVASSPSLKRRSALHLSKWYLDCVGPNGDTFIGYSARLSWHGFSIRYSSILTYDTRHGVRSLTSLRRAPSPHHEDGAIGWEVPRLGVCGSWEPLSSPIERRLYDDANATVIWSCFQPSSRADIALGGACHLVGLGYVEHLEVTGAPWSLPLDELRWGRFITESETIVWVDWRGQNASTQVFRGSTEIPQSVVTDSEVIIGECSTRLTFLEKLTLRDKSLASGALSVIPGIRLIVPGEIANARETKWLSRAMLEQQDKQTIHGWAIHELVKFK
jgi:hypothetical protein